ncbi:NAD(P)-dependent oxidoreductase [Candidatus Njordibacter sp. Uisw_056]|jgi:UDP-glucose 4-epimerase|uniref:NAD-dependent epimerase/dehydratase family protein n=1 Tax=Candidatus Njordibacter sp. Uisw_056 TaxID=3230973 RepID=UPI003D4A4300
MIKRVLVTGATGFIGSNLLEHLGGQDIEVYRGVRQLDTNSDEFEVLCDLTDLSSISAISENYSFDIIVHLASAIGWSGQSYEDMFVSNVLATGALGHIASQMGSSFIFASAALVHGKSSGSINDLSQINLDTEYARTKYEAELLLRSILPEACILRIGGVFGYQGPSHLGINRSIAEAIAGEAPVLYGDGENLRNYIYVDDLAQTISDIIAKGISGTHLVAGQEVQSVRSMLQEICEGLLNGRDFVRENDSAHFQDQVITPSPELLNGRSFRSALASIQGKANK